MGYEAEKPQWPVCEKCGGKMWTLKRRPYPGAGIEVQQFGCSACSHIMKRAFDESIVRAPQF